MNFNFLFLWKHPQKSLQNPTPCWVPSTLCSPWSSLGLMILKLQSAILHLWVSSFQGSACSLHPGFTLHPTPHLWGRG